MEKTKSRKKNRLNTDINAAMSMFKQVKENCNYAEEIADIIYESLLILDSNLKVIMANKSFYENFHISKEDIEKKYLYELGNGQWDIPKLKEMLKELLADKTELENFEIEHDFPVIGRKTMIIRARKFSYEEKKRYSVLQSFESQILPHLSGVLDGEDFSDKSKKDDYSVNINVKTDAPQVEKKSSLRGQLIILTIRDITEQRNMEAMFKEMESRCSTLFERSPDSILIIEPETMQAVNFNETAYQQLGYSKEEFSKFSVFDYEAKEKPNETKEHVKKILQKGYDIFETKHRTKDGRLIDVLVSAQKIKILNKDLFFCIFHNITPQKKIEESFDKDSNKLELQTAKRAALLLEANRELIQQISERREIESRIRASNGILKLSSKIFSLETYLNIITRRIQGLTNCRYVGIRLLDEGGKVPYEAFVGFREEFFKSENLLSVGKDQCVCTEVITGKLRIPDTDFVTQGGSFCCKNTIEFWATISGEEKVKFRNGCIKSGFKSVAVVPINYKDRIIGVIHIADDEEGKVSFEIVNLVEFLSPIIGEGIFKFKQADRIEQFQKELMQAKRLSDIGALASTIAHELRNPLAAIQMAVYNIKRKAQNHLLDKHLINIEKKVTESDQIINNLLFYARIKTPNYENINLYDILNECIKNTKAQFSKYRVQIIKKLKTIKNVSIEADSLQMKELIANILNNAFDAVLNNKGKIEITVESNKLDFIKFSIKDNGVGIKKDDLSRILEPFFTTKAKGTGLGLSVCNQIVSLHKGKFSIDSQLGKGTTVIVILPIRKNNYEKKNHNFIANDKNYQ